MDGLDSSKRVCLKARSGYIVPPAAQPMIDYLRERIAEDRSGSPSGM
jgi:hypothetical protein